MVLLQIPVPTLSCDSPCRAETETAVSAVSVKLQQGEAASRSAQSLVVKHNILASARQLSHTTRPGTARTGPELQTKRRLCVVLNKESETSAVQLLFSH